MKLKIRAADLKVGDLLPTGVVTHRPSSGVATPRGKIEFGLNGILKVWGKNTMVTIEREG